MGAIISPCGTYRYRLERDLGGLLGNGKTVAWIMVNPSTADATENDPTIRKVIGFSRRLGFGRIVVGNLFAFRATDIKALRAAADPIGPEAGDHFRRIMDEAETVIVAWGPCSKLPKWLRRRWCEITGYAQARGITLMCLGTAQDGHPLHPLMLGYERPLIPWVSPEAALSAAQHPALAEHPDQEA